MTGIRFIYRLDLRTHTTEGAVKEKKVELYELFYDLVFVYAISRVTLLLEEPTDGILTVQQIFFYVIATLSVIQAWLYMTNYINRYGRWKWYDLALLAVNMFAAIYLSQSISPEWSTENSRLFMISMVVLVMTVMSLYLIQLRIKVQDTGAAKQGVICLSVVLVLLVLSLTASFTDLDVDPKIRP